MAFVPCAYLTPAAEVRSVSQYEGEQSRARCCVDAGLQDPNALCRVSLDSAQSCALERETDTVQHSSNVSSSPQKRGAYFGTIVMQS